MAVNNSLRAGPAVKTDISKVLVFRDSPAYIEKSIKRLAILEDVPVLKSPAEIRDALDRWRHVLFTGQVHILDRWLAGNR